jgi:hypothetical protein
MYLHVHTKVAKSTVYLYELFQFCLRYNGGGCVIFLFYEKILLTSKAKEHDETNEAS